MPRWEHNRLLFVAGAAGAAMVAWALAFRTGAESPEWNDEWTPSAALHGTIAIQSHRVETAAEREERLASETKEIHEDLGEVKRAILGDKRPMLGNAIGPVGPEIAPDFEFSPREACLQMKLAYPERYGDVDCMSSQYDGSDVLR